MLTINDINSSLINAEYAVRGKIVERAQYLESLGQKIIYCNIGNPHALGQKPLTYIRQTLSLLEYPELLNSKIALKKYPKDIIEKAKQILQQHPYGTGAYSQSLGIEFIRSAVADFIQQRDNITTHKDQIILTDGASKGVQAVLQMLLKDSNSGIMIPIPQYPLYSATITLYGGHQIHYYLDEHNRWELNEAELENSYLEAKKQGVSPRAIAVINPGNPTGAVLTRENIRMVINFATKYNLCILADEVYQDNVYDSQSQFHSFAKILDETNNHDVSLFSFHSVSKGFLGECGHRGGYIECRNIPQEVFDQLTKLQSINLCANIAGQLTTYLMVNPPKPESESYPLYLKERTEILNNLHQRARVLAEELNSLPGVHLHTPQGSMYIFVRFDLPHAKNLDLHSQSVEEIVKYHADRNNKYCLELLNETGICTVPGTGFGQVHGTYHFRLAFLPPLSEIQELTVKIKDFHLRYLKKLSQ